MDHPLFETTLGPGTLTSAGICEWTLEFGPMEFVEAFYVTDRRVLWGPYWVEDLEGPIVVETFRKGGT